MQSRTITDHLRLARLGHLLVEAVPGSALRIGRPDREAVVVAPPGDPRAEVLLCQHRAALTHALETGRARTYADALGFDDRFEDGQDHQLAVQLLPPPGADLGSGVLVREDGDGLRRVLLVTTLCPTHAAAAVRAARTVPMPAHEALTREPGLADLTLEIAHDRPLRVTLLAWRHRPHPAVVDAIDDVARAASAACAVEELLAAALAPE